MSDHTVAWRIDDGFISGTLSCTALEGAMCRRGCVEACGAEDCEHETGDVGRCLAEEWIEAAGDPEDAHKGEDQPLKNGPVRVYWDRYGWLWTYPTGATP